MKTMPTWGSALTIMGVAGALLGISGVVWAVGDAPMPLDQRQAKALYASVRPWLDNEGRTCPDGQVPVSGVITSGAGPSFGSQTVLLTFDHGAVVRIIKRWSHELGRPPTSSVTITCP